MASIASISPLLMIRSRNTRSHSCTQRRAISTVAVYESWSACGRVKNGIFSLSTTEGHVSCGGSRWLRKVPFQQNPWEAYEQKIAKYCVPGRWNNNLINIYQVPGTKTIQNSIKFSPFRETISSSTATCQHFWPNYGFASDEDEPGSTLPQ